MTQLETAFSIEFPFWRWCSESLYLSHGSLSISAATPWPREITRRQSNAAHQVTHVTRTESTFTVLV